MSLHLHGDRRRKQTRKADSGALVCYRAMNTEITKTRQQVVDEIMGVLHQEIGGDVAFKRIYYGLFWNGPEKPRTLEQWFKDFNWFSNQMIHRLAGKDLRFAWQACHPESKIQPFGESDDQMKFYFGEKSR